MSEVKMDRSALAAFLEREFPQASAFVDVRSVAAGRVTAVLRPGAEHLRPGGTVSGPALFALADVGVYLAVLSAVGPEALAVTTSASIDFMRKPPAETEIVAEAELLKCGRALAVGDVRLWAAGVLVARATLTYSLPLR